MLISLALKYLKLTRYQGNMSIMKTIPELPKSLYSLRDAIINSILKSTPVPELQPLYEWLETDGRDVLIDSWCNEEMAVNLNYLAQTEFIDSELGIQEGIKVEDVTDEMRLDYSRKVINDSVDDGYICPSIHAYKLEQDNDTSPVIGCLMEIHGQSGPVLEWWGVFKNHLDFYKALDESNFVLFSKSDELNDERLITLWKNNT
jgi:hypothetical protein